MIAKALVLAVDVLVLAALFAWSRRAPKEEDMRYWNVLEPKRHSI